VTLTDYLPRLGLLEKPARKPRRRAVDEVELLRLKQTWADSLIKTQRVQLDDADRKLADEKDRREVAEKALEQAEAVIRLRDQRIADLERKVDVGVKAEHVVAKTQELSVDEIRRHCITPVPLHQAPFATTDPGRI
jgi:hypothetical protein